MLDTTRSDYNSNNLVHCHLVKCETNLIACENYCGTNVKVVSLLTDKSIHPWCAVEANL